MMNGFTYPSTMEVMKKTGLKSIKEYINQQSKQVEKHLIVGSTPMTNIMESFNIDVSIGMGYLVDHSRFLITLLKLTSPSAGNLFISYLVTHTMNQ